MSELDKRGVHYLTAALVLFALAAPGSAALAADAASRTVECLGEIRVRLEPLAPGGKPLKTKAVTNQVQFPADSSLAGLLLVTERPGAILVVNMETGERREIGKIPHNGSYPELGLVGFAFYPDFALTRRVATYLMNDPKGSSGVGRISEWVLSGEDLSSLALSEERVLFELEHPQEGHNGGQLLFGPDGYLYTAFGDGGFQQDPRNLVQQTDNYFGAMLRIDPRNPSGGKPYGIPEDNPFVSGGHLPEVYAWGFRNPFRFTFGPAGELILADVGQDAVEEINLVVAGGNYGWSLKEGSDCFRPRRKRSGSCDDDALIDPIHEYKRPVGQAVIGGHVYHGEAIPSLRGLYVFGDHISGRLFGLELPESHKDTAVVCPLGGTGAAITTFGVDPEGELLVGTNGGRHYRVVPR